MALLKKQNSQRDAEGTLDGVPPQMGGSLSSTELGLLAAFRGLCLSDQVKVLTLCLELSGGQKND